MVLPAVRTVLGLDLASTAPERCVKLKGYLMRLDAIAKVIRSKNAGPCLLTLDVMLPDAASFAYVTARLGPLRRQVAQRYRLSENEVAVLPFEPALAVKITLPREIVSGDIGDRDVYGAQQHAALLDIEL
jgi:Domain of unknown function (DUF4387)